MKSILKWSQGMSFAAECDNNTILTDAKSPLGQNKGMTPKELVLTGLGGCTAMDVVALLKKHKQPFESLNVEVESELTKEGYPQVFKYAVITFKVQGLVDPKILMDSVTLSQTKYCGVTAMLLKAFPINYVVLLNGTEIGKGVAQF